MDLFSPRHLLIVLLIVLLVFGTKKLKTIGSDLGGAFKGFKQAMKEGETDGAATDEANKPQDPKQLAGTEKPAEQRPAEQRPAATVSTADKADKEKAA